MPFAVDVANDGTRKYASLCDEEYGCKLWSMDYEMNCMRYGCLFVKGTWQQMFLTQANPEPFWISAFRGDVEFISVDLPMVVYLAVSLSQVAISLKTGCR